MASINWLKATTQKAGAMKKHLDQEAREHGNHSNPDIDKSLSCNNYTLGCSSYSESLHHMKERTKVVDAIQPPKRVRKDRVTCCFLQLPCPRELTEQGKSDEFFKKAHAVYEDFFGKENVHGTFVHKDEVHEYRDKNGAKKISCEHAHTLISAFTEDKGINGKAFETRTRIKALNKAMDDMCIREFGIHLNTGENPERKSVERLKEETALRSEIDYLQNRVTTLQEAEEQAALRFMTADEQATEREYQANNAEQALNRAEQQLQQTEQRFDELIAMYDNALKYEQPPRKVFESQESYDIRVATGQQAVTINQRTKELDSYEKSLDKREKELRKKETQLKEEKERFEKIKADEEKRIAELAEALLQSRVLQALRGISTNKLQRLENFCKKHSFSDGTTVLDRFEEQEKQLEQEALKRAKDTPLFSYQKVMSDEFNPISAKSKNKNKSLDIDK